MYIKIGSTSYTEIRNLSFAPETDVSGSQVPVNQFSADIITDDVITAGSGVKLYDDRDNLWADYWLTFAERVDKNTVQIVGQSYLTLLDRTTLPAVMYSSKSVSTLLSEIMGSVSYTLDSSFSSATVTGFCPEQTARERLLWVCFVIGAYVKSFFNSKVEILPVDTTVTTIPSSVTYWKPAISYNDYVTAVKVVSYSYTQGTPANTDTWVTDGTNYYIQTQQVNTLSNPDAPASAPENVVTIEGVTLVNSSNVSA